MWYISKIADNKKYMNILPTEKHTTFLQYMIFLGHINSPCNNAL